jgi:hypothetical protein
MTVVVELLYIASRLVIEIMSMRAEDEFAGLRQLWLLEWRPTLMNGVSKNTDSQCRVQFS